LNHLKLKHSHGLIEGNSAELNAVTLIIIKGPNK